MWRVAAPRCGYRLTSTYHVGTVRPSASGSGVPEQHVARLVDRACQPVRAAAVRMRRAHQPVVGRADFASAGAGLAGRAPRSLRRGHVAPCRRGGGGGCCRLRQPRPDAGAPALPDRAPEQGRQHQSGQRLRPRPVRTSSRVRADAAKRRDPGEQRLMVVTEARSNARSPQEHEQDRGRRAASQSMSGGHSIQCVARSASS